MFVDKAVNHEEDKKTSKSHPKAYPIESAVKFIEHLMEIEGRNNCKKKKFVTPGFFGNMFKLDLKFEFTNSSKNRQLEILRNIYSHLKKFERLSTFQNLSFEMYRNNKELILDWFVYVTNDFNISDETYFSAEHYLEKCFEEEVSLELVTNATKAIFFACTSEEGRNGFELEALKTNENANPLFESGHEKGFEKQEYVIPGLDGEKIHPDLTGTDVNNGINPLLVRYIYFHARKAENELSPLFREPSFKICKDHRDSFIDWIVFMTENFKLSTQTLHLAVRYFDEYICKEDIGEKERDLALVGTTAVFLACKIEETIVNRPTINQLVQYSSSLLITKDDILKMEEKMLKALDFKLSYPTSYQFFQIFCHIGDIKGEVRFLAEYLCDVALLTEYVYYSSEPSKIAAAAIALSNWLLNKQPNIDDIEVLTGYRQCDIKKARSFMYAAYDLIQANVLGYAVKAKYSTVKYMGVSVKDCP